MKKTKICALSLVFLLVTAAAWPSAALILPPPFKCQGNNGFPIIQQLAGPPFLAHPEIIPIFLENPTDSYWEGQGLISRYQILGGLQAMANSAYFAPLAQYGATQWGGPGGMGTVRMVPETLIYKLNTIPLQSGSNAFNDNWPALQAAINGAICEHWVPPPAKGADHIYTVLIPPTWANHDYNSASQIPQVNNVYYDSQGPKGCPGWGGKFDGNTYSWTIAASDMGGLFHETVEVITGNITYNNGCATGNPAQGQIADICGPQSETYTNGATVAAYYSDRDHACVVQEGWSQLWSYNGSPNSFTQIYQANDSSPIRRAAAGDYGLFIGDPDDRIYQYNFVPNSFTQIGGGTGPDAPVMMAVGTDALLTLQMSMNTLSYYTGSSFTNVGLFQGPSQGFTSVMDGNGITDIGVTDFTGATWVYNAAQPGALALQTGGTFDQVAETVDGFVAIALDHSGTWMTTNYESWPLIGNQAAYEIFTGPDSNIAIAVQGWSPRDTWFYLQSRLNWAHLDSPKQDLALIGGGNLFEQNFATGTGSFNHCNNPNVNDPPWTAVWNGQGQMVRHGASLYLLTGVSYSL